MGRQLKELAGKVGEITSNFLLRPFGTHIEHPREGLEIETMTTDYSGELWVMRRQEELREDKLFMDPTCFIKKEWPVSNINPDTGKGTIIYWRFRGPFPEEIAHLITPLGVR